MKKVITLCIIQLGLVMNAAAHPGPIGHSHDDDWPFQLLIILAAVAIVVSLMKKLYTKNR